MNDSKKSLALDLTVVTHKASDSRHVSFVAGKSIAFPCAHLLGDHRKGDGNTLPCRAVSGFRGNLPRTWGSWIRSTSLYFFKRFLWLGWLFPSSDKASSLFSYISVFGLLNTPIGKLETTPLIGYSLAFFCKFIWSFHTGGSKATMITDCMSLVLCGSFVVRWWR